MNDERLNLCSSPLNLGVVENGDHVLKIMAFDLLGNLSSREVNFQVDFSTEAGVIAWTSAGPDSLTTIKNFNIDVSFSSRSNASLDSFYCSLNSDEFSECNMPLSISLQEGENSLSIYAIDSYGVQTNTLVKNWKLDTIAPKITVSRLPSELVWKKTMGKGAVEFTIDDNKSEVLCELNSVEFSCTTLKNEFEMQLGQNIIKIQAIDQAGNLSSVEHKWMVERPHPIGSGADGYDVRDVVLAEDPNYLYYVADGAIHKFNISSSIDEIVYFPALKDKNNLNIAMENIWPSSKEEIFYLQGNNLFFEFNINTEEIIKISTSRFSNMYTTRVFKKWKNSKTVFSAGSDIYLWNEDASDPINLTNLSENNFIDGIEVYEDLIFIYKDKNEYISIFDLSSLSFKEDKISLKEFGHYQNKYKAINLRRRPNTSEIFVYLRDGEVAKFDAAQEEYELVSLGDFNLPSERTSYIYSTNTKIALTADQKSIVFDNQTRTITSYDLIARKKNVLKASAQGFNDEIGNVRTFSRRLDRGTQNLLNLHRRDFSETTTLNGDLIRSKKSLPVEIGMFTWYGSNYLWGWNYDYSNTSWSLKKVGLSDVTAEPETIDAPINFWYSLIGKNDDIYGFIDSSMDKFSYINASNNEIVTVVTTGDIQFDSKNFLEMKYSPSLDKNLVFYKKSNDNLKYNKLGISEIDSKGKVTLFVEAVFDGLQDQRFSSSARFDITPDGKRLITIDKQYVGVYRLDSNAKLEIEFNFVKDFGRLLPPNIEKIESINNSEVIIYREKGVYKLNVDTKEFSIISR